MKLILIFISFLMLSCNKQTISTQSISACDNNDTVYVLFIGQSNLSAKRNITSDVTVPSGYAVALNGALHKFAGVMDWIQLPDTSGKGISYLCSNEATVIPPFIVQFHNQIQKMLSIVKYQANGTTYGDWQQYTGVYKFNWGDASILKPMTEVTDTFLNRQKITRSDLDYIIMYLGESDGGLIGVDIKRKEKSLNDLYVLIDKLHTQYVNAKILIIETSYPANQKSPGFVSVRDNQKTVALNRSFVYIVDSTTKYFPRSWSQDGLHLTDSAYDHMGTEAVKNMKKLFY